MSSLTSPASLASRLAIGFEKISDVWPELLGLALQEQNEINEQRPFNPDWKSMRILNDQGIFQLLTARVDGRMVGYFTWLLDFDMESKGVLVVNQTAWFVEKGHPIVGVKMLDRAISEFKRIGVEFAYFHHTVSGRGAKLGRLFESRGAKLLGYNYSLALKAPKEPSKVT